jgi:hypothetical protein
VGQLNGFPNREQCVYLAVLWIDIVLHADPDQDPTFHFDAVPDPDPDPTPKFTHVGIAEMFFLLLGVPVPV